MMTRLITGLLLSVIALGAQAQTPSEIVQSRSKSVVQTLVSKRDEFRADRSKLEAFVRSELDTIFDREYSARLVLARHSRSASDEQIVAFADALTNNLLRRYGEALLEVTGELDIRIRAETPLRDGKMMRVNSEIVRPDGPAVPIDYLFRNTEDGWRVFDVIVEGVSYVQTYRSQFDALLRTDNLDTVTRRLAEGSLRAGD